MSFTKFQNEETPLQAIKTIFPMVLTHSFGPKIAIFLNFISQAIQARKMSFVIFQNEKTPFQAIKTRTSNSRKIDIFFKRVNPWFSAKNGHFLNFFFFWQHRQGKCLLRYSRTKNASLGYKNKKFQKSKNLTFFRRG